MKPRKELQLLKVVLGEGDIPTCGGQGVAGLSESRNDEIFRVVLGSIYSGNTQSSAIFASFPIITRTNFLGFFVFFIPPNPEDCIRPL